MNKQTFNDIVWSSFPPEVQTLRMLHKGFLDNESPYMKRYLELLFDPARRDSLMPGVANGYKDPYALFQDAYMHGIKAIPPMSFLPFMPQQISYGFGAPAGAVYMPGTIVVGDDFFKAILGLRGFKIFDPGDVAEYYLRQAYPKWDYAARAIDDLTGTSKYIRQNPDGSLVQHRGPTTFEPAPDDIEFPGTYLITGQFRGMKKFELREDGTWETWWESN